MRRVGMALTLAWLISLVITSTVFGHSGLHTASPDKSEVVKEPLTTIKLTFNTVIEADSRIDIQNEAGESLPIKLENGKDSMTGLLEQPLPNGKYTVYWTIVGEDTHSVQGNYSFVVEMPEATAPSTAGPASAAPDQEPAAGSSVDPPAEQTTEPSVVDDQQADQAAESAASSQEAAAADNPASPSSSSSSSSFALDSKSTAGIAALVLCVVIAAFGVRSIIRRNRQS